MSGSQQLLLGGAAAAAPAVDPFFYSVTSLLHGDGTNGAQNNTFLDSSTNNFTITRNGNTTQGSFSPFSQTGWGNYFDGSGDYLETPSNAAFTLGSSGDFTVECWVYATAIPGNYAAFMTTWSDANTGYPNRWFIGVHDSKIKWFNDAGASAIASPTNIALNIWTHVAAVRNGSTITLYINGTAIGTQTTSQSYTTQGTVKLGYSGTGGNYFSGYLSNARVVKGTAVYTSNFTVPTTPLTAITNTSLLTCQANRFLDASSNAFAITRNGDVSVQPFSPFNPLTPYSTSTVGGSGYFDGSGDYLTVPDNAAFDLGSGAFTLECFAYLNARAGAYDTLIGQWNNSSDSWLLFLSGNTIQFYGNGALAKSESVTITTGQWYHFACTRDGSNNLRLYANGVKLGSDTAYSTTLINSTANPSIGCRGDGLGTTNFNGYLSSVRVIKGGAEYTGSTYTVPTAPLTTTVTSGTVSLLTNFTNAGIFDNAAVADYETVGNAQISTSVKKYGTGSMAFDGTGDYLVTNAPSTQLQNLGSGDFTVEMWLYFNNVSSVQTIIDWRDASTVAAYPLLVLNSDGTLLWSHTNNTRITSGAISASTWYHVAVCRVAGQTKLFINGSQSGSTYADSTTYLTSTGAPRIGIDFRGAPLYYFNGYIDDLRISKGIGRYPYNFTPPTAEFPNIGGTVTLTADPYFYYTTLLLPGNGTNGAQNNTFLDSSTNAFSITRNGNTTQGTFSPFSQTGWGAYFDGTGDYLSTNATQAIPATGDFTIEAWVYPTVSGAGRNVVSQGTSGSSGRLQLNVHTDNTLQFGITSTLVYSTGTVTPNAWNYIAVTRTGSSVSFYINNGPAGTATLSGTVQNTALWIGAEWSGDPYRWLGYISNVRISNVVRTITAAPTAAFTSDANTVVLTCQSNRFIDNSTNAYTITVNGDVSVQAFSPFNPTAAWSAATYGGSGYFDGSGDSLTFTPNSNVVLTGDFTIDFWLYFTSSGTFQPIIDQYTNAGFLFRVSPGTSINGEWYINSTSGADGIGSFSGTSCNPNSWNFFRLIRSGSTVSVNCNGVQVASRTRTGNVFASGSAIALGSYSSTNFSGYISGFRILNGTAATATEIPSAPPTAITNTQLLLNYTNAGIYDATSKNDLETVGNAQISTTQSKFGGSSMYFDGTGDYLYGKNTRLVDIGSGDFTIEGWLYPTTSGTTRAIVSQFNTNGTGPGWTSYLKTTNVIEFYGGSGTITVTGTTAVSANAWSHFAICRYGSTITIYVNGVAGGTGTNSSFSDDTTGPVEVGARGGAGSIPFTGYINDFRITKGIARYTSNFTPPTTAFLTL